MLHGVSEQAAVVIVALAAQMREMSDSAGIEAAAMVDADSGEQLGEILPGGPYGVVIKPHINLMRRKPGRYYVQLHTHVQSTSFSEDDAATLVAYRKIAVMSVAGIDGTWYIMSKTETQSASLRRAEHLITRFLERYDALKGAFEERVARGEQTEAEARREHPHEVWLSLRGELGLRYDRVSTGQR